MRIARYLRLLARYSENIGAVRVKLKNGTPETFWELDRPWFHELGIQSVIDVGANEGQFSTTLRLLLPNAQFYAFEPIPECFQRIRKRFANDPNYMVYNIALGERKSRAKFTVASDTGASSLLPMSDISARHFPHIRVSREIEVPVETLDEVLSKQTLRAPYLLKVDVQGYEFQVLSGGIQTLSNAKAVIMEASYVPFYDGQKLMDQVYDLLRLHGFSLAEIFNMMHDKKTGRALQGDFLFLKS
jgi:FkbM family methyltransferase